MKVNLVGRLPCRLLSIIIKRHYSSTPTRKHYAKLTDLDVGNFEKFLGSSGVLWSAKGDDLTGYNSDWLNQYKGASQLVLRPKSTEDVASIVNLCYEKNFAICVQGGNTGLVGGSVPVFDEIILNTSRMNEIYEFDGHSGILSCQSGCILENLDNYVGEHGYMMPLDLGAKGSCQIGGNVSTAAGGIRFVRYGSLHGYVLGLEVVVPQQGARTLNMMTSIKKDNTGLHLPHLFIGAEGQLGVLTKIAMVCVPKPVSVNVAFLGLSNFNQCCETLKLAKRELGEILSSFEFIDNAAAQCALENSNIKTPLDSEHDFYLLIETMGSNEAHDNEKLESFLEICLSKKVVQNGCLASDSNQSKKIWRLRDGITESLLKDGHVYKCDISLPTKYFYEIVEETRKVSENLAKRVVAYGHLGDGNLHLNVTSGRQCSELENRFYIHRLFPFIYKWTWEHGGSISAEHGLGLAKRNYLHYAKRPEVVDTFRRMKHVFDPKLILNPYKCLPD